MKPLDIIGSGVVKFSSIQQLNSGNYLVTYLLQHITDNGKKSHFTLKHFSDVQIDPFLKDTEIEFTGVLRENNYKDKDGAYKTSGLEVIANEIYKIDIFGG